MQATDARLQQHAGGGTANSAVWSLLFPPAQHILCHAVVLPALAFELARRGARVDVVTPSGHGDGQSATRRDPRLRCLREADTSIAYELALLWDPSNDREVRAWLAALARLPRPPREVAVRLRNPWRGHGPAWPLADLRLRRAGLRLGAAHLAVPEADRVRQIVDWRDYAQTELVRHRRSHSAWKARVAHGPLWRWFLPVRMRRASVAGEPRAGSVLDRVLEDAGRQLGSTLQVERLLVSPNGIAIASVRAGGGRAILKLPYALAAEGRAARNATALGWLADHARELGAWAAAPPRLVASGSTQGWAYTLEERVDGEDAQGWNETASADAMRHLEDFLRALARLGEPSAPLDAGMLERVVGAPVRRAAALLDPASARTMQALGERLHRALEGIAVPLVPRHGDFKLENVLGTPLVPERLRIVDWELWSPRGLPLLDLWHLVASRRARAAGCAMGTAVRRWVLSGDLAPMERDLLERASRGIDPRYAALAPLLYWLDRVGPVAARGAWPREGWERANVLEVLGEAERAVTDSVAMER